MACDMWRDINEKHADVIQFLNADPLRNTLDVTIDNSVQIDVIRKAQKLQGGEWVDMIQEQSVNSETHRVNELKTKEYLEQEYQKELKRVAERERQEEENERLARELARKFSHEEAGVEKRQQNMQSNNNNNTLEFSEEEKEEEPLVTKVQDDKDLFDLEAWLQNNPDIRKQHEEAERRLEQMRKDEEIARKLEHLNRDIGQPQLRNRSPFRDYSTPPSPPSSRKRKRCSFVSEKKKKKKKRKTPKK